jgi:acyl dehydratase
MMGGFLTQHVQDWAGPGAFLRKLAFRNRVMAYPGDSLTCHGVVTDVSSTEEGGMVECDLWMENQRGEKVVDPASALLRFPLIAGS